MIGDSRIDLTEESKFGADRTFIPFERDFLIKAINKLPWRHRRIEPNEPLQDTRERRSYGDQLTDDMRCVVRRCSDGSWFFGDPTIKDKPYFEMAFAEELMECRIPDYNAMSECLECGTKHIIPNLYDSCYNCKMRRNSDEIKDKLLRKRTRNNYIPWKDYRIESHYNKEKRQWEDRINNPPESVIREILN